NVDSLIDHHHLGPHRILCTSLPIFHVNALYFSFLSSLLSGTKLILMESFIAPQIWEVIQDEKVQILSLVPQLIRYMLREKPSPKSFNLSSLEYIVSAAAPLSQSLVQKFHETFAKKVIQGYGLSEAVNFSCTFPTQCDKSTYQELVLDSKIPSIGTALACNEVVILDRLGKECKQPYIEGEIAIRGANVMRSYRGETNSTQNSNNMLVTGDLGYFIRNKKGEKFFFISGRIKDIIKKNGFTLSLREVDDIISEFEPESIQGIAVPFKGHEEAEDFGIVLSLQHPNQNIDLGDLEKRLYLYLVSKLPQYLRPSVAILVNQPVFAKNGKVIRPPFAKLFDNFINQNIGRSIRIFDRRDT
ncbi:MAG: acyl--CoA ligase, partial [Bdellovibrionales bacterium]|nr:acyl--CoA ligase [Bdellovibrionales bacterium]